ALPPPLLLLLQSHRPHPSLPSFPTRRSSDLANRSRVPLGMRRGKSATPGGVRFRRSAGFSALISATVTPAARATVDRSTLLGTTTRSNSHGGSGTTPA